MRSMKQKLFRDSRNPYIKPDLKTFGFSDIEKLASPENDAIKLAELRIAEGDFEGAKHQLVLAWLLIPAGPANEPAFLRLRDGFVKLYTAKGEEERALRIQAMPTMLLAREVEWIAKHPEQQLAS